MDEARKIALKLNELKQCGELLFIAESQVVMLDSMVTIHKGIAESYKAELGFKDQVINLHLDNEAEYKDQIKVYKKRSVMVMVGAAVLVGIVTLIAVK